MKCQRCQFDNREGAKFCKECGNKLELEMFILEKTGGVPFFIEELMMSLKDLKVIERRDNRYRITKELSSGLKYNPLYI